MAGSYAVTRGCTMCCTCQQECSFGAVTLTRAGAVIDPQKCTGCGACYRNCPSDAIVKMEDASEDK